MKPILLYLLAFCLIFNGCDDNQPLEGKVPIVDDASQSYHIPDENLVKALKDIGLQFTDGHLINDEKLATIRELDLSGREIQSLVGLDLFTELRKVNLSHNKLKNLDIDWIGLTKLRELDASFNLLKEFNIQELTRIETLKLQGNTQLEALNGFVPQRHPYLRNLYIPASLKYQAAIVEFYYSKRFVQPDLNIQVETVDGTELVAFNNLYLKVEDRNFRNYLKTLPVLSDAFDEEYVDLEKLALITELECSNLAIRSMSEIRFFRGLTKLICNRNGLKELDLSQNINLLWVDFSDNQISEIDVTKNTKLINLLCLGNNLTTLDLSKNAALENLFCLENNLSKLDLSALPKLKLLNCDFNPLTSLNCENNPMLQQLTCEDCILKELNVSACTELMTLLCGHNVLTSLDVKNLKNMSQFHCMYNKIKELNLSGLTKLRAALCGENEMQRLIITGTSDLSALGCMGALMKMPDIEGLDATVHTKIKSLSIPESAVCGADIQRFYHQKHIDVAMTWSAKNLPYTTTTCEESQSLQ